MPTVKAMTEQEVDAALAEPKEDKRKQEKKLQIVRDPSGLYRIEWTAGGELPDSLKGHYTSVHKAQAAIDTHANLKA